MKKIIVSLLICILSMGCLIGCGSDEGSFSKKHDELIQGLKGENGEITELTGGIFYNTLAGVAPNSKLLWIVNKDKTQGVQSLVIEMNIKKTDKKTEIIDFADKTIDAIGYLEDGLVSQRYKNLIFLMYVDGKFTGNSISYEIVNDKLEHKGTEISDKYWDDFNKAKEENKIK